MTQPDSELAFFDEVLHDIAKFLEPAEPVTVVSPESCSKAMVSAKHIKMLEKAVEDRRKAAVAPLNDRIKNLNAYAKTLLEPLMGMERQIKAQLVSWETKLAEERAAQARAIEAERRKKEAEIRALAEEERKKKEMLSSFGMEAPVATAERKAFEAEKSLAIAERANDQNRVSGTSKVWTFRVTDESLVPREFCAPVPMLIREAVKNGARDIPGVQIFEETRVAIR